MSSFFESYLSTGMREDVLDALEVVSPDDTPVYNGLRKGSAIGVHHEWLEIALPTASAVGANSFAEGAAFTYASGAAYQPVETRRHNYCQIFQKTWKVSGTIEAVGKYGRDSEWAMRKMMAMRAFKVDIEVALLDNSASGAGASGSARTMDGLRTQNGLSATANASTSLSSPIDEGNLNVLMQTMWEQGISPDRLVCSPFVKRQISNFSGATAAKPREASNGERELVDVLDVYESDFGRVSLIPSRRLNIKSDVIVFQNDMLSLPILRSPSVRPTPNDGDFLTGAIVGELTHEYLNANSLGRLRRVQSA
jgi:hypothetical protein